MRTLILSLAFLFSLHSNAKVLDRVLAVVGSEPILQSEVDSRLALLNKSRAYANIMGYGQKTPERSQVLREMIEENVIETSAQNLEIVVSDLDVRQQIASIASQNNLSREQLEASLQSENIPLDAYAKNIRLQLLKRGIIERELRNAVKSSEEDLRNEYRKIATREYELLLLEAPKKQHASLKKDFTPAKWSSLSKKYSVTELGWVKADNLKKDLSSALKKSSVQNLIGPFNFGGKPHLVYLRAERVGSDEEFNQIKGQLAARMQSNNIEERFSAWLETQKKNLNIVVNKK